ncbi:MAG: GHKL domain-containing protein [Clostridia bacterium]|nr:GHKL domain-containing protein [Clostridia bacterium]
MFEYAVPTSELAGYFIFALFVMAMMLMMLPLKVRKGKTALWAILASLSYIVFIFLGYTGVLQYILPAPNRLMLILTASALFCLCLFRISFKRVFIAGIITYSVMQLMVSVYLALMLLTDLSFGWRVCIFAACLIAEFAMCWFIFMRGFRKDLNVRKVVSVHTYVTGICGFIVAVVLYNLLMYTDAISTLYGLVSYMAWIAIYVALFVSAYIRDHMIYRERAQQLINAQKEKEYQAFVSSIEVINVKCHDLRKYSQDLKALGRDGMEEYIGELDEALDVYNSISNTGSFELDTILSEKKLECEKKDISMDYIIDARYLNFISGLDLYMLFGNAIDNAIEACCREDAGRRILSINVGRRAGLIFICIENSCQAKPGFRNGMPVTTKEDSMSHGYGSASIRSIAEKYGGNAEFSYAKGRFAVSIILPVHG